MQRLKSKKLIISCCIGLIAILVLCSTAAILTYLRVQKVEAKEDYNSDVDKMIEACDEAKKIGSKIEATEGSEAQALDELVTLLDEYTSKIKTCSQQAQNILNNDKYNKYEFSDSVKEEMQLVAAYDEEMIKEMEELTKTMQYLAEFINIFDQFSKFSQQATTSSAQFQDFLTQFEIALAKLKQTECPETMQKVHTATIKDMEAQITYMKEFTPLFKKAEDMEANPNKYTYEEMTALIKQMESIKQPSTSDLEKNYNELETTGQLSDKKFDELDSLESEFINNLDKIQAHQEENNK